MHAYTPQEAAVTSGVPTAGHSTAQDLAFAHSAGEPNSLPTQTLPTWDGTSPRQNMEVGPPEMTVPLILLAVFWAAVEPQEVETHRHEGPSNVCVGLATILPSPPN